MKLLVILGFTVSLAAQSVNSALVRDTDHGSVLVQFTGTPGAFAQVVYGTKSGGPYPYASESSQFQNGQCSTSDTALTLAANTAWLLSDSLDVGSGVLIGGTAYTISAIADAIHATLATPAGVHKNVDCYSGRNTIAIGALAPSTTYYFVVKIRPNQDNDTGVGSSSELSFTTPAATHPVAPTLPAAVAAQVQSPPDTSAYTVVRMIRGLSGECEAAADASGPSWTVSAGDKLQTVIDAVGYGTVIEFDQSITCDVPNTGAYNSGYILRAKPTDLLSGGLDDPAHGWIVFRTQRVSANDFPPVGVATDPTLAAKAATLKSTVPVAAYFVAAQHFGTESGAHHYRFENLKLAVDTTVGTQTTAPWQSYVQLGRLGAASSYIQFDQMWFAGPGRPGRVINAFDAEGDQIAVTNSYINQFECGGPQTSTPGHLENTDNTCFSFGLMLDSGGNATHGPYLFDNNFVEVIGLAFYAEGAFIYGADTWSNNDITYTHNRHVWPISKMPGSATWDGYSRVVRQQWEVKTVSRVRAEGNLIKGQWSYQNEGPAFFVSGPGNADITIQHNWIKSAAVVFDCLGVRPSDNNGPPDGDPTRRVYFGDNLATDLGRHSYTVAQGGGGLSSAYFQNRPGCQDLNITQNTLDISDARGPSGITWAPLVMLLGGGSALSEGFRFRNNVLFVSKGNPYYGIATDESQRIASHPRLPAIKTSGTSKQVADSFFVTTTANVAPAYDWGGNIMIPGRQYNETTQADLDAKTAAALQSEFPAGDIWFTQGRLADRIAAAGLDTTAWTCSRCGDAGASPSTIGSAMGVVRDIVAPLTEATTATFAYTAPDSRACSIDTSGDAGVTWMRTNDGGGAFGRVTVVRGLTAATRHQWRILCYYRQVNDGVYFTDWTSDQITEGTLVTGAAAATDNKRERGVALRAPVDDRR